MRSIACEVGLLTRADGSASFNQGDTSVMAASYGPIEAKMSKEMIDKANIEVVYKSKVGVPGCAEKAKECIIRNTCETMIVGSLHPHTYIEIIVQEMQNSGSLMSCMINAACMALLDSALPMRGMFASVTVAKDSDGNIIIDPDLKQEQSAMCILTFAFDSTNKTVITVTTNGSYSNKEFQTCLALAKESVNKIFSFYREAIEKKLSKDKPS